jgi:hypothetical protein
MSFILVQLAFLAAKQALYIEISLTDSQCFSSQIFSFQLFPAFSREGFPKGSRKKRNKKSMEFSILGCLIPFCQRLVIDRSICVFFIENNDLLNLIKKIMKISAHTNGGPRSWSARPTIDMS